MKYSINDAGSSSAVSLLLMDIALLQLYCTLHTKMNYIYFKDLCKNETRKYWKKISEKNSYSEAFLIMVQRPKAIKKSRNLTM